MGVLMPNTTATIRRRGEHGYNSMGERVQGGFEPPAGDPLPALIEQRGDGGWALAVDDDLWPVREGDAILDAQGRVFIIRTADLLQNVYDSTVNYVRCEGLHVSDDGTEPQDSWFVGRDEA